MKRRNIVPRLDAALADTPVVLLHGARQTGKTTLVQRLAAARPGARYYTFDDAAVLAAATGDPPGFLADADDLVILDEVQKAPELLSAIKLLVDRDRRPGRFLLTGSAHVLMLPKLSESLAGRMEILTLWPFSQGEIEGVTEGFVDAVFADSLPRLPEASGAARIVDRVVRGGFPEAAARDAADRRSAWFAAYLTTILQRDVRELANINGLTAMPRLLSLLAARTAGTMNKSGLSRDTGFAYTTLDRYLALLETTFLLQPLPAWSANLGKRLTRAPKLHLCDSGLVTHLIGATAERLMSEPTLLGSPLESFVAMELRKQATWSKTQADIFHFRTSDRKEVDIVLEDRAGRVVAIEVKASATFGRKDVAGLRFLADALGDRFRRGILLYNGESVVPLGSSLHALPINALWALDATSPHSG